MVALQHALRFRIEAQGVARRMQRIDAGEQRWIEENAVPVARHQRHDLALDGLQLYPGLVAANTQLGLVEVPTVRGTVDVQEGGALNPNARPRAEDLAQTTASLARSAIEPDAAMGKRRREIRAGLVEPW